MKQYEEIVKELDSKIPREHVSERSGGNGRSLSYLEGHYVINRLNQLIGQGNWGYEIKDLKNVFEGKDNKDRFTTSYIAQISFWAKLDESKKNEHGFYGYEATARFDEVGYGDGTDNSSPGKAHELATKEAVTDALKRAAKNLGQSMGLALYDKTQSNVEELEEVKTEAKTSNGNGHRATEKAPSRNRETKLKLISATAKAAVAKGTATSEQIKNSLMTQFNVSSKEELNDDQVESFLATLQTFLQPTQ